MNYKSINLRQKFGLFEEQWQPKVIADETFIIVEGDLRIDLGMEQPMLRRERCS